MCHTPPPTFFLLMWGVFFFLCGFTYSRCSLFSRLDFNLLKTDSSAGVVKKIDILGERSLLMGCKLKYIIIIQYVYLYQYVNLCKYHTWFAITSYFTIWRYCVKKKIYTPSKSIKLGKNSNTEISYNPGHAGNRTTTSGMIIFSWEELCIYI
jgi:hypothetical protein